MENKFNNNPDYDAGYEDAWASAIKMVLDIADEMKYTGYHLDTLEELMQRIV
jgi:hypothetical protein